MIRTILFMSLFILCDSIITTQPAPTAPGEMWAVVIGITEYKNAAFKRLPCAVKDAQGLQEFLLDMQGAGLNPERLIYLPNAQGWQIDEACILLKKRVRPEDRVLFYYAGHGEQEEDPREGKIVTYLVPTEGKAGYLYRTGGIPLNKLQEDLWALPAHQVALVLDCCYSGTVVGSEQGGDLRAGVVKPKKNLRLQRRNPPNRLVLSSCGAEQQAMELQEYAHGAFTFRE